MRRHRKKKKNKRTSKSILAGRHTTRKLGGASAAKPRRSKALGPNRLASLFALFRWGQPRGSTINAGEWSSKSGEISDTTGAPTQILVEAPTDRRAVTWKAIHHYAKNHYDPTDGAAAVHDEEEPAKVRRKWLKQNGSFRTNHRSAETPATIPSAVEDLRRDRRGANGTHRGRESINIQRESIVIPQSDSPHCSLLVQFFLNEKACHLGATDRLPCSLQV